MRIGELVEVMEGLGEMVPSITQRLTLLVYDDIEAVHDHLVTVFGFGPGRHSRDDVDAHHARAVAAGADVVGQPRDEGYGYREYDARDLEGGLWSFMSPVEGDDDG